MSEVYRCKSCNLEFKTRNGLWKHHNKYHNNLETNKSNNKKKEKINCKNCEKTFTDINMLDKHIKTECTPDVKHNNVFTFKVDTFGKNKYPDDKGGDIYIIQTEFNLTGYYKIGITTNLYKRLIQYRCGAVLEPRVHCYFPIKNIKDADKTLKIKLEKYNVKREIYKTENLQEIKNIIKDLQKEMKSEINEVLPEIKQCDIIKCDDCNIVFTNKYEFNIHRLQIHNDKKSKEYKCKFCDKTVSRSDSLQRHEKSCNSSTKETDIELLKSMIVELQKDMDKLRKYLNYKDDMNISEFDI